MEKNSLFAEKLPDFDLKSTSPKEKKIKSNKKKLKRLRQANKMLKKLNKAEKKYWKSYAEQKIAEAKCEFLENYKNQLLNYLFSMKRHAALPAACVEGECELVEEATNGGGTE